MNQNPASFDEFGSTAAPRPQRRSEPPKARPTLTILSHPNLNRIGEICPIPGSRIGLSRLQPEFGQPGSVQGKPLADPFVSREPILIERQKNGLLIKPAPGKKGLKIRDAVISDDHFEPYDSLDKGLVLVLADRITLLLHWALPSPTKNAMDYGLVGASDGMVALRKEIARVADLKVPVLLLGGSGTGKEVVARAIHGKIDPRRPWVGVNMGAISPNLAASELFGSVKGAYTGSQRNQLGYFRAAQNGTLFLDEIGETPVELQVLLLRALESSEVTPVGSQISIPFQTRLIAATDADLKSKVAESSFKEPLLHRLASYEIRLPSLRERREDFGRLFMHFAKMELEELGDLQILQQSDPYADPWLPTDLVTRLVSFSWPGNVRQLRNLVRQLVIGCRGKKQLELLPKIVDILREDPLTTPDPQPPSPEKQITKKGKPKGADILAALKEHRWDIKLAADALGMSRGALYLWMDKTPGIRKGSELSKEEIESALATHGGNMEEAALSLQVSQRALQRRFNQLGLDL